MNEVKETEQKIETNDYDGYYDDVQPIDSKVAKQEIDLELVKRVITIIAGVAVIIGLCIMILSSF